jgi:hypothetical protein
MVALTEAGTLAFVARTDAQRAASVEQFRIAVPQSNVAMVIWIVVGTGPIAAAGLDQIEQSQRELDTLGARRVRTLVTSSLEADAEWFDINGRKRPHRRPHRVRYDYREWAVSDRNRGPETAHSLLSLVRLTLAVLHRRSSRRHHRGDVHQLSVRAERRSAIRVHAAW